MSSSQSDAIAKIKAMSDTDKVESILSLRQAVCELSALNRDLESEITLLRHRCARLQCKFPNEQWALNFQNPSSGSGAGS
jgi:hypothetical protein